MGFDILAGKEKEKGLRSANNIIQRMYDQSRADVAPYRDAGQWAISQAQQLLQGGMPNYEQSPDYQFQFNEGMRALNNSANAAGALGSSGNYREAMRFGQGLAATDYDRFVNRFMTTRFAPLMNLAGMGAQYGVMPSVEANQWAGNQQSQIAAQKGQARGSMYTGTQNMLGGLATLGAYGYGNGWWGGGGGGQAANPTTAWSSSNYQIPGTNYYPWTP